MSEFEPSDKPRIKKIDQGRLGLTFPLGRVSEAIDIAFKYGLLVGVTADIDLPNLVVTIKEKVDYKDGIDFSGFEGILSFLKTDYGWGKAKNV